MRKALVRLAIAGLVIALVGCGGADGGDSSGVGARDTLMVADAGGGSGGGGGDSYAPARDGYHKPPEYGADAAAAPDTAGPAADVGAPPADGAARPDAGEEPDTGAPDDEFPPTNPFVVAAHDPQSTFAADVDTASYDIFRQRVQLGMLPPPGMVRLEEFVNYFRYGYPAPTPEDEAPFSISLAAAPCPFRDTLLLRVGIQGQLPPPKAQKPVSLTFLVDVSGSMSSANKLGLVKVVLRETLEVLDPDDTVAIVTYAGATRVALAPTPVAQAATIRGVIDGLQAGGSTYGAGGIQLAYEQAEDAYREDGINHVLLCTDGDFNVGVSDTASLVRLIEEKRRTGITLTVLGFGYDNLNDSMMEAISNAGNGVYAVISSADQAIDYVHDRLLSTLVFIAKDMKIQVEFNPARVFAYRLLGYENRAIADSDFTNDRVDAGEVGAGHQVTALYDVVLSGDAIPDVPGAPAVEDGAPSDVVLDVAEDELVLVKVRYKDVDATEDDPAYQVAAGLAVADVGALLAAADEDLRWAAAIAAFAEILKHSPYGDPAQLATIDDIVSGSAGQDADRLEFLGLFETARGLLGE
jgi:Ca-activated chloride channel family protein